MKLKLLYILLPLLVTLSCSSITKIDKTGSNPEITLQTTAAFKSAERINENEWQLIFRKLDDCQYVLFYTDISKINSFKESLIRYSDNSFLTNPDFVNIRFSINYVEETSLDQVTGENAVVNRLRNLKRIPSDRFAAAGFSDDTMPDDFIINLKKHVAADSAQDISGMISFPLEVINRKKRLKIKDPETFIKDYNNIFNKKIKTAILNQPLADVQANSKGLIIGAGEICINLVNDKIYITSINNY